MVVFVRIAWLTLVFMMLLSRVLFQWYGPERMRAFLNAWQVSKTKRVWGIGASAVGLIAVVWGAYRFSTLGFMDRALWFLLALVTLGDGLLNLLPHSFRTFKDKMQEAWIRRDSTPEKASDKNLFGVVNLMLALASLCMGALVVLYKPIGIGPIAVSLFLALAFTILLIRSCWKEAAKENL